MDTFDCRDKSDRLGMVVINERKLESNGIDVHFLEYLNRSVAFPCTLEMELRTKTNWRGGSALKAPLFIISPSVARGHTRL